MLEDGAQTWCLGWRHELGNKQQKFNRWYLKEVPIKETIESWSPEDTLLKAVSVSVWERGEYIGMSWKIHKR